MQRYSPRSASTWKRKSVVLQRRPWANTTGSPGPPLSSYWSSAPSTWIRGMRGGLPPALLASILNGRMGRSGSADLPLHGGRVPEWLASRMARDGGALARTSRLVAKVDSAAVQDGFDLYLHGFVAATDGAWVVVQQGMRARTATARRYHWLSESVKSFVEEPHAAIEGEPIGAIVNLTDRRAAPSRNAQVALSYDPDRIVRELRNPHLQMPGHHDVRPTDVFLRRVHATLAAAAENGPKDFAGLLLQ